MELNKNKNDEPESRGEKRKDEIDTASPLVQRPKPDSSKCATNAGDTSCSKLKRLRQTARRGGSSVGPKKDGTLSSSNIPKQTASGGRAAETNGKTWRNYNDST